MSSNNTQKNENSQLNKGQIVMFWKHAGETLAVMLRRFREERGISPDEKITYAGRLDPMAEGIVPLLVGEARFQKEHLMAKSKTYEVEILLGIGTDTGDMLGIALDTNFSVTPCVADIEKALEVLRKTDSLSYPNYSSVLVDGKPLFMHARAGNTVEVPIKHVTIYSMELLGIKDVSIRELLSSSVEIIEKVQGDFRQKEIVGQWMKMIEADGDRLLTIVTIRTAVSSGTYMRSLAEKMGKLLGVPALAYKIKRTNIEA